MGKKGKKEKKKEKRKKKKKKNIYEDGNDPGGPRKIKLGCGQASP